jgi:DNA-directed RNA polymerase specialized sigma24 family protein
MIARNEARMRGRRKQAVDISLTEPAELCHHVERDGEPQQNGLAVSLTDPDFVSVMNLLPDAQRQAITLRKVLGFSAKDTGVILGRSPVAVRKLEHHAMRFLESRLEAFASVQRQERSMLIRLRRLPVIRARRFVLWPSRSAGRLHPSQAFSRPR